MPDGFSNDGMEGQRFDNHTGKETHSEIAPRGVNPATIVVADDDDAFREALLIWLSEIEQWDTREASDGEEALDNLDDAVDLLVLDRGMPKLSGPEVVERLPTTPFGGSTIVLSADRQDACLNEDDVEMYLLKPISRENFLTQVEQCLP